MNMKNDTFKCQSNQQAKKLFAFFLSITMILGAALQASASDLSEELARARAATAKYHDVTRAETDGYVQDICDVDGCHWFNFSYYDETFDIEHPEALNYVPTKDGGWRLVAVEYIVPSDPSLPPPPAPEGFTGFEDDDGWRFGTEGFPDWELTAWIWFNNPNGMFEIENPRLEGEEH
jgi:hypothetical protein